jgi:hypothetical protein
MKDSEDEAFDDLAKKQGDWGSGFQTKRRMAADKMHWSDCAVHNAPAYPAGKCDCGVTQEPVACMSEENDCIFFDADKPNPMDYDFWIPLYTYPPQRPWVGLTDADIADCMEMSIQKTCRAVEAKLKEKNT